MCKKSYSELITIDSYEGRFKYLKIGGRVGEATFGHDISIKYFTNLLNGCL